MGLLIFSVFLKLCKILFQPFQGPPPGQGPPRGPPPGSMQPDPRGPPPRPDWNRPPGPGTYLKLIVRIICQSLVKSQLYLFELILSIFFATYSHNYL